jgi:defect-in-organelle-trafficking protein DotC
MYFSRNLKLIYIVLISLFTGCANSQQETAQSQISAFAAAPQYQENHIRMSVITDTARSIGAQAALAKSSENINDLLNGQNATLSQVFNFQAMMLDHNVMPPVLEESTGSLNLDSDYSIRLADRIYKISKPAHFVTTIPDWRDYLLMNYDPPETPDNSLLPKSNQERDLWNQYIMVGWNEGIHQAQEIFAINVNRLQRDYLGMILYRKLLAQNIVSPPFVSRADLGITGGGDRLRINDQVLRITAISELKPNSKVWKARLYSLQRKGKQTAKQATKRTIKRIKHTCKKKK